jgi:hypothetical protein
LEIGEAGAPQSDLRTILPEKHSICSKAIRVFDCVNPRSPLLQSKLEMPLKRLSAPHREQQLGLIRFQGRPKSVEPIIEIVAADNWGRVPDSSKAAAPKSVPKRHT